MTWKWPCGDFLKALKKEDTKAMADAFCAATELVESHSLPERENEEEDEDY